MTRTRDKKDTTGTEQSIEMLTRLNTSSKLETDWLTTGFKYMRLVRDLVRDRVRRKRDEKNKEGNEGMEVYGMKEINDRDFKNHM